MADQRNFQSRIELLSGYLAEKLPWLDLSSMKVKGYLFSLLLALYIAFIVALVLSQRHQPFDQLEGYKKIQQTQQALAQADLASFHIVMILFSDVSKSGLNVLTPYFSTLREQYIHLQQWFPEQSDAFSRLIETIPANLAEPSNENTQKIYLHLRLSKTEFDRLVIINRNRLAQLVESYSGHNNDIVVLTLVLGIIGLILFGVITSLFFTRLKKDLDALQSRTTEIVLGYRGPALPVYRKDELGRLTEGVNYMANALAEREQALDIRRSEESFMDKMVAIDSLAGGIAHEIGNPITCIAGLADGIKSDEDSQLSDDSRQSLGLMLGYIDGLVGLTHELNVLEMHKRDESEWLDINLLITNTVKIYNLDKRWSNTSLNLDLDSSLPALFLSTRQLTQLLCNILENALDATRAVEAPEVNIQSLQSDDDHINLVISDNGTGMEPEVLKHIFEPFYSTKPTGHGTGLGLAICWSIVRAQQGKISASSEAGIGSQINIVLPINKTETN